MTFNARTEWVRFAGFGWVFALLAAAGVLQVVVLVRVLGSQTWGEVALAQSAAALTAAIAAVGWNTVGASMMAVHDTDARVRIFSQSLVVRAYAFLLCAPVLAVVVWHLAAEQPRASALLAVAGLVPVLGASWYFIGQGNPSRLFLRDALPQVAGMLLGLPLAATLGLTSYAMMVLVGNLVSVGLGVAGVRQDGPLTLPLGERGPRGATSFVLAHRAALFGSWAGSLNSYLPTLVVARLASASLPSFALADRMLRYALGGYSPVVQFIQGWVPRRPGEVAHRSRLALGAAAGGGVAAFTIVLLAGAPASRLLSGGEIVLGPALLVPFGLVVGTLMVGQVTALAVLVPLEMTRTLAVSTSAGTLFLLVLVAPAAVSAGARGVAWSMAACEVVAVGWQVLAVLRATARGAGR